MWVRRGGNAMVGDVKQDTVSQGDAAQSNAKQDAAFQSASFPEERILRFLEIPALVVVPVVLAGAAVFQVDQSALLTLAVALVALAVLFASYEAQKPALRQVVPTAVLGALAAAGRILLAPIPDFKPVSAICIVAGVVFGRRSGFAVGALAALVSNFFFGQGPWTPWQMYAWGLVGYFAGVLADAGVFSSSTDASSHRVRRLLLYVYGFFSALLYGFLLNGWTLVGFVHPITWQSALAIYGAGFPFDLVHGLSTVFFLVVLYEPWKRKLNRIKRKYALRGFE